MEQQQLGQCVSQHHSSIGWVSAQQLSSAEPTIMWLLLWFSGVSGVTSTTLKAAELVPATRF
jgi:hypothetical protein